MGLQHALGMLPGRADDHVDGFFSGDMRQIKDKIEEMRIGFVAVEVPPDKLFALGFSRLDKVFSLSLIAMPPVHNALNAKTRGRDDSHGQPAIARQHKLHTTTDEYRAFVLGRK